MKPKITELEKWYIWHDYDNGLYTQSEIAREFEVSQSYISHIVKRQRFILMLVWELQKMNAIVFNLTQGQACVSFDSFAEGHQTVPYKITQIASEIFNGVYPHADHLKQLEPSLKLVG